jgi:hypothetical protein
MQTLNKAGRILDRPAEGESMMSVLKKYFADTEEIYEQ